MESVQAAFPDCEAQELEVGRGGGSIFRNRVLKYEKPESFKKIIGHESGDANLIVLLAHNWKAVRRFAGVELKPVNEASGSSGESEKRGTYHVKT